MRLKRLILASSTAFFAMSCAAFAAKPTEGGYWLQEAATPVMEELIWLHNFVSWIILGITLFVMVLMGYIMFRFSAKRNPVPSKTTHHVGLEVAWTLIPVIILLVMVVPSMRLLYFQDKLPETEMTVKVVGNTWNWEYVYPDFENVESFISNPLEKEEAEAAGVPYLLATDAPLVVPVDTKVKVLVTSSNNLHSFAMPAFGVKMDAVPGRINETWFEVLPGKEGTYYGQCSEICGIKHYKMPIEIKVVSKDAFKQWVANDGAFTTTVASVGGGMTAAQE
ncbi:cytochrome c oxidase subunit II [Hellea balneolensis]|uniref:cytochrome c oxidase subunit II n=1 Tax=Hellea balneolensis TaxID=287478 RepID=UPI00040CBD7A|nr:cytochrome c oxidase subunit II [Hellea balneolensis]